MTTKGEPGTPAAIVNEILEQTRVAMRLNRFDLFLPHTNLPFTIVTQFGVRVLDTPEALQAMFQRNTTYYRKSGVLDVVRYCLDASQTGPNQITALYETRLIHSFQRLERAPYDVLTKLERGPNGWGFVYCDYAVQDSEEHLRVLSQIDTGSGGVTTRVLAP